MFASTRELRSDVSRGVAALALLVLATVHLAAALTAFDPPASMFTSEPIEAFDFCVLEYQIHVARGTFQQSGRLWGYDPFFLGGYVLSFIWNSNVALQLVGVLLPQLPAGLILKLATLLGAFALPWLVYLGWRGFGFMRTHSLLGAMAGVLWFRLSVAFSWWAVGMTTGWFIFPLSFAALGMLAALLRGDGRGYWLVLFAPLLPLVHKTAAVTVGLPALGMLVWSWRKLDARKLALLVASAALTVAVNLFWLVPLLRYLPLSDFDPSISYWTNPDALAFFKDLTSPHAKIGIFSRPNWLGDMLFKDLVVFGCLLMLVSRRRAGRRFYGFGVGLALVALMAYGGSFVSLLRPLDPSRYVPYLYLLLTLPATCALIGRGAALRLKAFGLLAAGVVLCSLPSAGRYFAEHPVIARPSAELELMAEWISRLDAPGRVHVETYSSFEREAQHIPWNEQLARVSIKLPVRVRVPLLGGHYSGIFTKYNATNFYSGVWMKRPLSEWTEDELREAFRRYNVSYILTWSREARRVFSAMTDLLEPVPAPEPFDGWRVKVGGSWFLEGSGELKRVDYDLIELENVVPSGERAVLSFHWAPTLVCEGAELVPVRIDGDPVPFIGLLNPAGHVVITNGSAW